MRDVARRVARPRAQAGGGDLVLQRLGVHEAEPDRLLGNLLLIGAEGKQQRSGPAEAHQVRDQGADGVVIQVVQEIPQQNHVEAGGLGKPEQPPEGGRSHGSLAVGRRKRGVQVLDLDLAGELRKELEVAAGGGAEVEHLRAPVLRQFLKQRLQR